MSKPASRFWLSLILIGSGIIAIAYFTFPYWQQLLPPPPVAVAEVPVTKDEQSSVIKMTEQACANLGLCSGETRLQTYWKKIQTTGVIIDRPGFTDRGVTAPVDSVISKIHALEGDTVKPGDRLFTLRVVSEYLQQSQSDYFKAVSEIKILESEIQRIQQLAETGVIPEKRIIVLNQEISRQNIQVNAHQQELLSRGFDEQQLTRIANGDFIKTIEIVAPHANRIEQSRSTAANITQASFEAGHHSAHPRETLLEVQELKVQLGQQIKAGELLTILANHNYLYINGFAFKKEAANIARAAEMNSDLTVEFLEDSNSEWKPLEQELRIRHMSNTIDPESRTFDFFVPLKNQFRSYHKDGQDFVVWRFRPGQRVRIHIPVEKMENVIVVPSESVVREGPNFYVFQQNGEYYNRVSVHVLHRDRLNTVLANDGSVLPGFYIAQNSAASLNRILKVQSASGENSGNFHVHADGTVHANH